MSDVPKVSLRLGIGALTLLLAVAWIAPGCASSTKDGHNRILLDDPPIRVKNQVLEVELFNGDTWDPLPNDDYKPKTKAEKKDYIDVIALKYGGEYCQGDQPFRAESVTLEYGHGTPGSKRKVKVRLDNTDHKIVVKFPGVNGHDPKKLEFGDDPADYLQSIVAKKYGTGPGPDFTCEAKSGDDQLLVYLY